MRHNALMPVLLSLPMAACQVTSSPEVSTQDLDGVWHGAIASAKGQQALTGHMLDGLMLSMHLDGSEAHSAEMVFDDGELAGIFVQRDEVGVSEQEYTLLGEAWAYERINATLLHQSGDAELDLFFDHGQSEWYLDYTSLSGLYAYQADDLQLNLSIDHHGQIEGYDDSGCAYFGHADIPDPYRNVVAISISVDGCELAGDYGYGIASLIDDHGWPGLDLPIWFTEQDRVEAWRLTRI